MCRVLLNAAALLSDFIAVFANRREQVTFSKAIGNMELMHECFPKHLRMGTARKRKKYSGQWMNYIMNLAYTYNLSMGQLGAVQA